MFDEHQMITFWRWSASQCRSRNFAEKFLPLRNRGNSANFAGISSSFPGLGCLTSNKLFRFLCWSSLIRSQKQFLNQTKLVGLLLAHGNIFGWVPFLYLLVPAEAESRFAKFKSVTLCMLAYMIRKARMSASFTSTISMHHSTQHFSSLFTIECCGKKVNRVN